MLNVEIPEDLSWRHARLPKKTPGEYRYIKIPNDSLKAAQEKILNYLYAFKPLRPTRYAHGFVPHRGCMTAVLEHPKDADVLLHMDVKDFFDNLPVEPVRKKMLAAGMPQDDVDTIIRLCSIDGHFPQGGPCSPWLTNIGMIDVDLALSAFAQFNGLIYTRYADDILISVSYKTSLLSDNTALAFIFKHVDNVLRQKLGLRLSMRKNNVIRLKSPAKHRSVLGVTIRKDFKGYNADRHLRKIGRARLCNLAHSIMRHGRMDTDDRREWASVLGIMVYCDSVRAHSDPDACGPDPVFQEKYYNYVKEMADGRKRGKDNS